MSRRRSQLYTKSWSLWAPGLTKRLQRCLAYWLDLSLEQRAEQLEEVGARKSFLAGSIGSSVQHADQLEVDEASTTSHQACRATCGDSSWFRVAKLTKAEQDYKEHCLRGHIPFRKDCEVCVRSSGKDRRHLRQKYGHGYTLSLDLGGPYLKGKDLYQDQRHVLIGTYQFPILDKPEVEDGYSIVLLMTMWFWILPVSVRRRLRRFQNSRYARSWNPNRRGRSSKIMRQPQFAWSTLRWPNLLHQNKNQMCCPLCEE